LKNNRLSLVGTKLSFIHNAQLTGKKLLAKIATKEQKPTVFCPCLIYC
jgi:hypothetical protein